MASKCTHTCLPAYDFGTVNSARYQNDVCARDSGITLARLFSPYIGSGYTWLSTRVVSTVPGTVALYQPAVENSFSVISLPSPCTLPTSCICQPPMTNPSFSICCDACASDLTDS